MLGLLLYEAIWVYARITVEMLYQLVWALCSVYCCMKLYGFMLGSVTVEMYQLVWALCFVLGLLLYEAIWVYARITVEMYQLVWAYAWFTACRGLCSVLDGFWYVRFLGHAQV